MGATALPVFKLVQIKLFVAYLDQAYSSVHTPHLSKKNSNVSNDNYKITSIPFTNED